MLEAYTTGFDFAHLKFDSALRMFLESFKLPGEAQKIDRIINAFGRHYYAGNEDVFRCADAAYVLAYSVIMLNTDQHNNQVRSAARPAAVCAVRGYLWGSWMEEEAN